MRRLLLPRRNRTPKLSSTRAAGAPRAIADAAQLTQRVGSLVTRWAARRRRRSVEPARRSLPARRPVTPPSDDASMLDEWISLGAHLERLAPVDISADELAWVEDEAAERIHRAVRARYAG